MSRPSPSKPWKVLFGPHETIGFTVPALLQNVWESGPKGPLTTKIGKRQSKEASKNHSKINCQTTQKFMHNRILSFVFGSHIFSTFSDPEPIWPPNHRKGHQGSPNGQQLVTKMTPDTSKTITGFRKNAVSEQMKLYYIYCLQTVLGRTRPGGMRVAL